MARPRTQDTDQLLRAKAVSTARIQFSGSSARELVQAAETIFRYLKYGDTGEPLSSQELFNLQVRTLIEQGHTPMEALRLVKIERHQPSATAQFH